MLYFNTNLVGTPLFGLVPEDQAIIDTVPVPCHHLTWSHATASAE